MPGQNDLASSSVQLFEGTFLNSSSYSYGASVQTTGLFVRVGTFDFQDFEKIVFTNILLSVQDTSQSWAVIVGEELLGQFYLRDKYSLQSSITPGTQTPSYQSRIIEKSRATGSYITEFSNLSSLQANDIVINENDAVEIKIVGITTTQSILKKSTVWLNFVAGASFPNFEQLFRIDGIKRG